MSKRFKLVGSLLRPKELLTFKRQIESREDIKYPFYNDFPGFLECETKSIKEIVAKQIQEGISPITDAEFGRSFWHLDFIWGLKNVERKIAERGLIFCDHNCEGTFETRKDIDTKIIGPLSGKNHHFNKIFMKVKSFAPNEDIKTCIWAPAHAYMSFTLYKNLAQEKNFYNTNWAGEEEYYKSDSELKAGLVQAYKEFIEENRTLGGNILQFDDCLWELFSEDNKQSPFYGEKAHSKEVLQLINEFIDLNNELIAYAKSLDFKVWTHNCRGNYASRSKGGGSYSSIADKFLKEQNYDRFYLEWDDERAGDIEVLNILRDKDCEVVLGFLSSKTNYLDDEKRTFELLNKATSILSKEKLYLSHQCGFASTDNGNELTEEEQWVKIKQGQEIAFAFWGE